MRKAGATVVDVRYPKWLLDAKQEFYNAVRVRNSRADRGLPQDDRAEVSEDPRGDDRPRERPSTHCAPTAPGRTRCAGRCSSAKRTAERCRTTATRRCATHGLPMVRAVVEGILAAQKLDAIVYPTSSRRPALIADTGARRRRRRRRRHQHRQPHRLPRPDRAGGLHRRQPAGRASRSSARPSASRS